MHHDNRSCTRLFTRCLAGGVGAHQPDAIGFFICVTSTRFRFSLFAANTHPAKLSHTSLQAFRNSCICEVSFDCHHSSKHSKLSNHCNGIEDTPKQIAPRLQPSRFASVEATFLAWVADLLSPCRYFNRSCHRGESFFLPGGNVTTTAGPFDHCDKPTGTKSEPVGR